MCPDCPNPRPADNLPEKDHLANTFALVVHALTLTEAESDQARDLDRFIKEWIGGDPRRAAGQMRMTAKIDADRFTVLDIAVERHPKIGAECVRFETRAEERRNPKLPDVVMLIHGVGVTCWHPTDRNLLVVIIFSERHIVGRQFEPTLFDWLERNAVEPVFRSLELT